jgi:hypothetical protein
MTCKGYDSKAIKLPKQVKRSATAYTDAHQRGAFIRSFVRQIENENRGKGSRVKDKEN